MEIIVLLPAILMAVCGVASVVMMFKTKNEIYSAPFLVKFFGLQLIFPKYLTEQGKLYCRRYWQLLFLALLFGALTVLAAYWCIPEFNQEFNQVRANV
jgi:hypothetical protein